jgi:hypothetical protein
MKKPGEHIRVNFGQSPFVFDIDGMMVASIFHLVTPRLACFQMMLPQTLRQTSTDPYNVRSRYLRGRFIVFYVENPADSTDEVLQMAMRDSQHLVSINVIAAGTFDSIAN